ncbi:MAG: hypothetical protein V1851_01070 [Patescibacteria group bacterium]
MFFFKKLERGKSEVKDNNFQQQLEENYTHAKIVPGGVIFSSNKNKEFKIGMIFIPNHMIVKVEFKR